MSDRGGSCAIARVVRAGGARQVFRSKASVLCGLVEAAGIEPASGESESDSEEESDLASPDAGQIASDDGHEVAPKSDDPRSERGPSGTTATPPVGAGDEPVE